jgi:hypothetical protein
MVSSAAVGDFENGCRAHSRADAHANNTILIMWHFPARQFMEQRSGSTCTSDAQRVAESDRASLWIYLFHTESKAEMHGLIQLHHLI